MAAEVWSLIPASIEANDVHDFDMAEQADHTFDLHWQLGLTEQALLVDPS